MTIEPKETTMTDTEQPIDAQGLADRMMDEVYNKLTPGAIDNADLDGMAFLVEQAADQLRAPPPTDTATGALADEIVAAVVGTNADGCATASAAYMKCCEAARSALRQPPAQPGGDAVERSYCNKCGFYGVADENGSHDHPKRDGQCNYTASRPNKTLDRDLANQRANPPLTPPAGDDAVERAMDAIESQTALFSSDTSPQIVTEAVLKDAAKAALSTLPDNERGKVLEEAIEIIRLWIDWGGVGANYDSGKYLEAKERAFRLLAQYDASQLLNRQLSTPLGGV